MTKVTTPLPNVGGSFIREKNGALKPQPHDDQPATAPDPEPVQDKPSAKRAKPAVKED